jgi:hypothetical protein
MKNNFKVLSLFVFMLFILSCEDDNLDPVGNWELKPAVLMSPENNFVLELDELTPNETLTFSWSPAVSTANYSITYSVVFFEPGSTTFDTPIFELPSSNGGRELSLAVTHGVINEFLSFNGYPPDQIATILWGVKATSLSKSSVVTQDISFKRFSTEIIPTRLYVSGIATEDNGNLENAIQMNRIKNASGTFTNKHEIYTNLTAGGQFKFYSEKFLPCHQYGTNDSEALVKSGSPILVNETGQYRITVDLENNSFELLKIEKWSLVGDALNGGWSGDVPLSYEGGGIWKGSIQFVNSGEFVFRANENWNYVLKRIQNSPNSLVFESDASSLGYTVENIPATGVGNYIVTLDLSANGFSYSIAIDTSVPTSITTPSELFLFGNGVLITELSKSGDVFSSNKFLPLQSSVNYTLNSSSNGSGTSYSVIGLLGLSSNPDGDKVTGFNNLTTGNSPIMINADRGVNIRIDFSLARFSWEYYNFKLFHWSNWETRNEFLMEYEHPNTYIISTSLIAGNDMKFISPWDFDLGSNTPLNPTGTLVQNGGQNLKCITVSGNYNVSIQLNDTYQSGNYVFTQQ